jgi:7-carboxy-7-deazaguanine synthase
MIAALAKKLPLAPNPVFWTINGEGHLRGFQMAFLRLAGCSVGCEECDTDYRVDRRETPRDIAQMVDAVTPSESRDRWVWITGGEPTDHDLGELIKELKRKRFSIALATSGVRRFIPPVDWLSVSPHSIDVQQLYGQEVKLVVGLNGLNMDQWLSAHPDEQTDFMYRYVQPVWRNGAEDAGALYACLEFLKTHPNWSLSRQDHKHWGVL